MKIKIKLLLVLILCSLLNFPLQAAALDGILPDEGEMGFDEDKVNYRTYPLSHYGWDTIHEWFRMKGLIPQVGNVHELSLKSAYDIWTAMNNIMGRLAITFLQMAFNSDFLAQAVSGMDDKLGPIKTFFFQQTLVFTSVVFAGILVYKYAQGRDGDVFWTIIKAIIIGGTFFAVLNNFEFVLVTLGNLVDYIALLVLGVANLAPLTGDAAVDTAKANIMSVSNTIFHYYIEKPWLYGQFGTTDLSQVPVITDSEVEHLFDEEIIAEAGKSWAHIMLQHAPASEARSIMVDVMMDPSITHDSRLNTDMFVAGGPDRIFIAGISTLQNLTGVLFYLIIAGIQFISKLCIIALAVTLVFVSVTNLFGKVGERIIMETLKWLVFFFSLTIVVAYYIGIPILILNLIDINNMHPFWGFTILILLNLASIIFIPLIFKIRRVMVEAVGNVMAKIKTSGERMRDARRRTGARTSPPRIKAESDQAYTMLSRPQKASSGSSSNTSSQTRIVRLKSEGQEGNRGEGQTPANLTRAAIDQLREQPKQNETHEKLSEELDLKLQDTKTEIVDHTSRIHTESDKQHEETIKREDRKQHEQLRRISKDIKELKDDSDANDSKISSQINLMK